jgi:hypothetical protein
MCRHEPSDQQWVVIEKLISKKKFGVGWPQADPGKNLNGMLYS